MLRRLSLGMVALTALGLVTAGSAAAQDQGMGMSGAGPMGAPGMGMGGPGMGPMGMGMPGMGPGMGPGAGMAPAFATAIRHPGDLSGLIPCTGCGAIADPCTFGGQCDYLESGLWPDNLGLHPTTNRPSLALYFPQGPLSCGRGQGNNPARCADAPGEWNLRAGMPGDTSGAGGASR